MTISDAAPHNWPAHTAAPNPLDLLGMESSITFSIGPEVSPTEAMKQADAMAAMMLPRFLADVPDGKDICAAAQAVLMELVDVTARHKAGSDLVGKVAFDREHVTVSVGDMDCSFPAGRGAGPVPGAPHRREGGAVRRRPQRRVTWAAVPA